MTHDTSPSAKPAADGEAPSEAFLATLLAGFGLALADATAPALHRALDLFARAVLLDETRPEPHLGLAICYANLGDGRRAIRHFDTCLERGFGAGDYPELVYEYDDTDGQTWVVEIGLDRVLVWRAACHLALESVEPARSDLARVSDSGDRDVQAEIAVLWTKIRLAEGDLEGAQRQLSRALGLDPDQPDAHFVRGRIHEHRGNLRAALQAYSRAIRRDTEAPEFRIPPFGAVREIGLDDHRLLFGCIVVNRLTGLDRRRRFPPRNAVLLSAAETRPALPDSRAVTTKFTRKLSLLNNRVSRKPCGAVRLAQGMPIVTTEPRRPERLPKILVDYVSIR